MKTNQIYPADLTDAQWHCIKDLIPPAKTGNRPRSLEMRAVINAIPYLTVTGCQWGMMPKEYLRVNAKREKCYSETIFD